MAKDARDLEILVAQIQKQLAPGAEVIHDAKLDGRNSNKKRQIDVLVRQKIGQYEMLIVLDCKDYARRVDVKGVEEFHGLMEDVGAHKGALVCPKGFTEAAKTRAAGWQIDLFSPVDTAPHKWQVRVRAPVICDFRSAMISFQISHRSPKPFRMNNGFWSSAIASDERGRELGTPALAAVDKWNNGRFPLQPGEHHDLTLFDTPQVLVDNGYGEQVPVTLKVSLFVECQLFFGHVPITQLSGFKDELSGAIITNAFTTGIFDPEQVTREWQPISKIEDAPSKPMLALRGLIAWAA